MTRATKLPTLLVLLLGASVPALALAGAGTLAPEVKAALASAPGHVSVIVTLAEQADLAGIPAAGQAARLRAVVATLRATAAASQARVLSLLAARRAEGSVSRVTPFWVFNGLSVSAAPAVVAELAAHPDVARITPDELEVVPAYASTASPEPNLSVVRAPELWALGHAGAGVVVATLDSGADAAHPDLAGRWRGGLGGWFDPYGQHPDGPVDLTGHGTATLGVLLGGDAGGTTLGVAPEARWIAARIWDDGGRATATAIHAAFQWLLDPDGDPATADGPQVVNGSWSFGAPGTCDLEFQRDVQALRAADIVAVFAAGNQGPYASTSVSPANYPESVAVGATNDLGEIMPDGSRGPSACDGRVYPDLVAPGVQIRTAALSYGGALPSPYVDATGTSVAAPHVAGAIALLLSAVPGATGAQLVSAVEGAARDLGAAGPDDTFGEGLLDALAAHELLLASQASAPVASDDAFDLPEDTSQTFTAPGVLANDRDPNAQPLAAILDQGPLHGTLVLRSDGGFTYTPAADFHGADGFTYRASNGSAESGAASVALTVTPVNDPPVAVDDAASAPRNGTVRIAVLANDRDVDDALAPSTVRIAAAPRNGTATTDGSGNVTYTPRRSFKGSDAFGYTVADTEGAVSNVATVRVRVK